MRGLIGVTVGIVLFAGTVAAQTPDAKAVAAGQKVYETQKCSTCHQIKGQGGKLSTALDGVGTRTSEADIRKWLTTPAEMEAKLKTKPKMPMSTFLKSHKLSVEDVNGLVAYMLSLK